LNVASDKLERIVRKIPRLIELKEEGNPKYISQSIDFKDLVKSLIHDADHAFHMVDTVMKQIRAIQIQSIAIVMSNATDEEDIKMMRINLGDCLSRLFNIPRVRNDINAILCGKVNILDSSKNVKARLKSAFLCLIHIEKFNLSHKLPLVCNEAIVPFFSIKTILLAGILGDLAEYSEQEVGVIETLMEDNDSGIQKFILDDNDYNEVGTELEGLINNQIIDGEPCTALFPPTLQSSSINLNSDTQNEVIIFSVGIKLKNCCAYAVLKWASDLPSQPRTVKA
jgi:hypothetical protein